MEMSNPLCCGGSRSLCPVVSLQFPWMAEARLRLFPAGLFSCSFQQMLLGERWSLFLLAAGLVLLKMGSSFLGFGTADASNSLDLPWSCPGLLPNCCSRAGLRLAHSLPQGRAVPSPRNMPMENSNPLEFLLWKRESARPKFPGSGSRRNSVPKGKPWVCGGSAGPGAAGAAAAGARGGAECAGADAVPAAWEWPGSLSLSRGSGIPVDWLEKLNYRYAVGMLVME